MTAKAMEKINKEMQKHPNDPYREIIGQYIIDRCVDDAVAALVLKAGKTLEGALAAVTAKARAAAVGNVAMLTPAQVFGEVDRYFALATDMAAQQKAMMAASGGAAPVPAPAPQVQPKKMALDLADFM